MESPGHQTDTQPKKPRRRQKHRTAAILSAGGKPRHGPGRDPRTPEPSTPAIAQRQERHFDYHLQGLSVTQIAQTTGFARDTVALDIRMEAERRAVEMAQDRQMRIASSIARCEAVITRALVRSQAARAAAYEEVEIEVDGQKRKETRVKSAKIAMVANNADKLVLQAQKQIDAICGLSAPLPAGSNAPAGVSQQNLIVVLLEGMDAANRQATLDRLRNEAIEMNALPVSR